ncbi:hypothetical protein LNP04_06185 [Chryseobacterium sp. C-71]|uniref:hypothetical protein n=1 Tax=Chryseobacterium sp. C-71 TaxID=2893882 RepID=UPI001E47335E|nr:hypothetical protein [Chryseobacterium sp. C-71]UFH33304.1 hypothetical protein LNP04_06185 [Chryseobacterium sp. C-71]
MNKFLVFLIMICSAFLNAQGYESTILGSNITAPTASGIASKIKSPSAMSTGIPEIEIPFFSLATHQKGVAINLGLTYHPNNTFMESKASDVGLGWNVAGATNLIYREINSSGMPGYNYHFNFLGKSGTFQFTPHGGALDLKKVTENRYQISVTETGTGTNLYKFKIIDENGISYYFETLDISYYSDIALISNISYTGCYYLTRIDDVNGNQLVLFDYQEDNYTVPTSLGNNTPKPVKSMKISTITSNDFGSVHFNYTFNSGDRKSYQDPYQLNSVILKNKAGRQIERYVLESQSAQFEYPLGFIPGGNPAPCYIKENQWKRRLTKVLKYDTGSAYEKTEFTYPDYFDNLSFNDSWTEFPNVDPLNKCFPEEYKNPKYLGISLLKSIKHPNGTEVKYTFEPNQYYVDKSFPDYKYTATPYEITDRDAQYFENIGDFSFDFLAGPKYITFNLPYNPDEPDGYSYLFEHLAVGTLYTNGPFQPSDGNYFLNGAITGGITDVNGYKKYPPGNNTIVISGTGGTGNFQIRRLRYKSVPLPNYSTGKGVRIKHIQYLENNVVNDALTRKFNYEKFDGSMPTSGYLNQIDEQEFVVYKNIKETVGESLGYTKYYYKTLHDPLDINSPAGPSNELRYVNILANGLLEKREVFDVNHSLVQKDSIVSKLSPLAVFEGGGSIYGNYYDVLRNGLIEEQKTISKIYNPSGAYSNTSEIKRDLSSYNVVYEKSTGADGAVSETNITYPFGRSNRFWNKNMRSIPLTVEAKRNGSVVSKSETKFENTSHFYPTSQLSFLPDNLSQSLKNASFDIYDDKGNLVQYTSFPEVGSTGISTTIIYGYDKTLPIAKIEGAKLSDIPASFITAIVNASNEDGMATVAQEEAKEQALINALNTFKNDVSLQNFMITCYTYNPLIGITTTIPPNGMMELYKYDSFNRLLKTVDVNGNTIKEHKYNYKH